MFLMIMQFLWKYIDDLVGKGLDAPCPGRAALLSGGQFRAHGPALGDPAGSLMTFGNFGERFEPDRP